MEIKQTRSVMFRRYEDHTENQQYITVKFNKCLIPFLYSIALIQVTITLKWYYDQNFAFAFLFIFGEQKC